MFEDDGKIASVATSAVYDAQRGRLFLHGTQTPHPSFYYIKADYCVVYRSDVASTHYLQDMICCT